MSDSHQTTTNDADAVAKVRELVKDERTCMFTTIGPDGAIVSRPMATQEVEFDGRITGAQPLPE